MREHSIRAADFVFKSGRMNFAPHTRKLGDALSNTLGGRKYPSFKAALDDFVKDLTRDKVNEKEKK